MVRFAIVMLAALVALPLAAQAKANADETAHRKIEASLESTKLDVLAYEDADVGEVVRDIARRANIVVLVDRKALDALPEGDRKVTIELADIKAANALNLVLDMAGLHKSYKNGVLYIGSKEKAQAATLTRIYDVRDITKVITDFPAPELRLRGNDDKAGGVIYIPPEDTSVDTDDIVDLIEDTIDADWGGTARLKVVKGQLVVTAPRDIHKTVRQFLEQLRAAK